MINLFRKDQSKREECAAIIKKFGSLMDLPVHTQQTLAGLDLSVATDEQVETMHTGLTLLCDQYDRVCKINNGKDIFKSIKEIKN